MDPAKIGQLIFQFRKERQLTQQQLAQLLCISPKTVSKWETGSGCPDVALLPELSRHLGIPINTLLSGTCAKQTSKGGSMRNIAFYFCPQCSNLLTASTSISLSCCGRILSPLTQQKADSDHSLDITCVEDEWFLTSKHPMTKEHSLTFAALVTSEQITLVRQWPEWDFQIRLPKRGHAMLYWHCSKHGLFRQIL